MKPQRATNYPAVVGLLLLAGLGGAAGWGYLQMNSAAAALRTADRDLTRCRRLSREIISLRKLPRFAVLEAESPRTIAERVQDAMQDVRLPAGALDRIEPQSGQRLGQSPYQIRPTHLYLKHVTLAEAARFAHRLSDESAGLAVRDLSLSEPLGATGATTGETWTVEIVLTQFVFSPTSR